MGKVLTDNKQSFIWAGLFHMGTNMWNDAIPEKGWEPYVGEYRHFLGAADHVRFDEKVWRSLTAHMVEVGMNMVVIDLGEAVSYPSHPELAVKGSWSVERFRKELARLRSMGLEPIPKLNFSATHDVWLKEYARMLSTETYYKVCADVIRDVCEMFDRPRLMHLGYDEESYEHQRDFNFFAARQGELWWHDFLFLEKEVERHGVRPWIWSDYVWQHREEFFRRMPKSVVQSNWHYGGEFDFSKITKTRAARIRIYEDFDKAGFDQIPAGSNWECDTNFASTVKYCRSVCSSEHLKGFLMTTWHFTLPQWVKKNLEAIDHVGAAIAAHQ